MYLTAFILPSIGFVRLWIRAEHDLISAEKVVKQRGTGVALVTDVNAEYADITQKPRAVKRQIVWDTLFVFTGLGFGAFASITALPW